MIVKGVTVVAAVAGATLIVREAVAIAGFAAESFTFTRKVYWPADEGVQQNTPEWESPTPAGKEPEGALHLYGGVPPVAERAAEYTLPTTALDNAVVETFSLLADANSGKNATRLMNNNAATETLKPKIFRSSLDQIPSTSTSKRGLVLLDKLLRI